MKQITLDCSLFLTSSTVKYGSMYPCQMTLTEMLFMQKNS